MNIMMWAALSVLVAYQGNAELATLSVVLLTIAWVAKKKDRGCLWCVTGRAHVLFRDVRAATMLLTRCRPT